MADRIAKQQAASHPWLIPLGLITAALVVRLVYLWQIESIPIFYFPVMDEGYHVQLAAQINEGSVPAEPFYRAPLYPYFLALLFLLTDASLFGSRLIQVVMGSFLPLLVYALGLRLFRKSVAAAAGIATALYPTLIYYDAQLLITSLMVLLTTLLVWQLYRTDDTHRLRDYLLSGLLLGLAGLARPNILLLGPALLLWVVLVVRLRLGWRDAVTRYALVGLAAVVIVAPVTVRNYAVSGEFVPVAWQGGFNFYLGNNTRATGWSATAEGIDATWEGGYREAIAIAEAAEGRPLLRTEISDYWYGRAWDDIFAHPDQFLLLQLKKLRLFLNGYEIPNNQDIYLATEYAPVLKPLLWRAGLYFPFGLLAPLAILGLAFTFQRWRKFLIVYLVLGSYVFSLMLFFVCARYRQPLIPLMILLAAFAVWKLIDLYRRRQAKALLISMVVLGLFLWESNHDLLQLEPDRVEAENHVLIGNAYLDQSDPVQAAREYREAVAADPTYALAHSNLGMLFARRGNLRTAEMHFRQAIRHDPGTVEAYYNLATLLLEEGNIGGSVRVLEEAIQKHPYNAYAHLKLAMTYYEAGRLEAARNAVEESIRLDPEQDLAHDIRAEILRQLRDSSRQGEN